MNQRMPIRAFRRRILLGEGVRFLDKAIEPEGPGLYQVVVGHLQALAPVGLLYDLTNIFGASGRAYWNRQAFRRRIEKFGAHSFRGLLRLTRLPRGHQATKKHQEKLKKEDRFSYFPRSQSSRNFRILNASNR